MFVLYQSIIKYTDRGCLKSPQPSSVIPAQAGIQRNMCLEEAQYFLASVALK